MYGPLLTTKLYLPPPRPQRVARDHLIERLDIAVQQGHRLILLSAPAGFGKTTLLSEWLHLRTDTEAHPLDPKPDWAFKAGWLSLDAGDNDPVRFLAYLVSALRTTVADSAFGGSALAMLRSPQAPSLEAVFPGLINEISGIAGPLVLALDDYHAIQAQAIHRAIAFLLDHMPPGMHLALATRADPPLPLAQLRARGAMTELRAQDLRFSPTEAAAFLNQEMGLALSGQEVAALETRTEGWVAGLQLVALALQDTLSTQGRGAISSFIQTFAGDDRFIADYLVEEVLRRQPDGVQAFVQHTSILDRLCAPLCDAVLGIAGLNAEDLPWPAQPSSQQVLEGLEEANLFIVPLDRKRLWYRYHHLFAELLRHRMQRAHPDRVPVLHRRASHWFGQNGFPVEAVGHALAAGDFERAADMMESTAWALVGQGQMATLRGWLDALPDEVVRARPRSGLLRGWLFVLTMELEAVEPCLGEVERGLAAIEPSTSSGRAELDALRGEVAAIRATRASMQGDAAAAIEQAERALARLPEGAALLRGIVADILGTAYDTQGEARAASAAFAEAASLSQAAGNPLIAQIALGNLARVQQAQGQLRQAAETCRRVLSLTTEGGKQPLPAAGMGYIGLSQLSYEWNELEAAAQQLSQGMAIGKRAEIPELVMAGLIVQLRLLRAQQDGAGARRACQEAEGLARAGQVSAGLAAQVEAHQAQFYLREGDVETAARHLSEPSHAPGSLPSHVEQIARARLLLARRKPGEAISLLKPLLQAAEAQGRTGHAIEILVLQTVAYASLDDTATALDTLARALRLAEPEGYVRTFVDEGLPMAQLLRHAVQQGLVADYAGRLLAALEPEIAEEEPAPPPATRREQAALVESLSDRELEVLRLVAAGMTNREIATKLVLSVGTVKWHLHNIYGKLQVHNRTQAVAKARHLRLL